MNAAASRSPRATRIVPDAGSRAQQETPGNGLPAAAATILILDDYLRNAQQSASWNRLPATAQMRVLHEPTATDEERRRLFEPFDVIENMAGFYGNAVDAILAWAEGKPIRILAAPQE